MTMDAEHRSLFPLVKPEAKQRRYCPSCLTDEGLWESVMVPGWRSIDGYLKPTSNGRHDREVEWSDAEHDGWANPPYGCSCGWEGQLDQLAILGIDGKPLPVVHPNQIAIAE